MYSRLSRFGTAFNPGALKAKNIRNINIGFFNTKVIIIEKQNST